MKNLNSVNQLFFDFHRLLTLSITATCTTATLTLNMVSSATASNFFSSQSISQSLIIGSLSNSQSNCLNSSQSLPGISQSMALCSPRNGSTGRITIGGSNINGSSLTSISNSQVITVITGSQTSTSNSQTITSNSQTITQTSNINAGCLTSSQILGQGSSITQTATMCTSQNPITVINTGSSSNNSQIIVGNSQSNPVLPTTILGTGNFFFRNVPRGLWFDPPMSPGFRYTMTSESLFTKILDFPTGIDSDNLFDVSVENIFVGQFSPGQTVDFVALLGNGVKEFTISGIDPLVDPNNPIAFPIKLDFNTETASFKQKALISEKTKATHKIPEPSSILALILFTVFGVGHQFSLKSKKTY